MKGQTLWLQAVVRSFAWYVVLDPRISRGYFFLAVFFRVTHDELSERGTTRSLMACVRSQYNACSDWLILGHYFPVITTDRIQVCKSKAKSHIITNLLTSNFRSLRENHKPRPCRIGLAKSGVKIFLQTRHPCLFVIVIIRKWHKENTRTDWLKIACLLINQIVGSS